MKKKIYLEGEKSNAICFQCQRISTTTYKYRDVPFSDGYGFVKHILCDVCSCVIQTLPQSTFAIKQARFGN